MTDNGAILLSGHKVECEAGLLSRDPSQQVGQLGEILGGGEIPVALVRCQPFDDCPYEREMIEEIVELMVEVVCAKRAYTRVAGSDFTHEVVKARLLKLNMEHLKFVLSSKKCIKKDAAICYCLL